MHIQYVFRPLEELESSLVALYQCYADVFVQDAEACAMFTKLSGEETGHVALVRYQKKLVANNMAMFGEVEVDLQEVRQLTKEAKVLAKPAARPSLEEAVAVAFRFERSVGEAHLRSAMKQANPDLARLLNALCQGDKGHMAGLLNFAKKRGFPTEGSGI